jgi:hypothetical protein
MGRTVLGLTPTFAGLADGHSTGGASSRHFGVGFARGAADACRNNLLPRPNTAYVECPGMDRPLLTVVYNLPSWTGNCKE